MFTFTRFFALAAFALLPMFASAQTYGRVIQTPYGNYLDDGYERYIASRGNQRPHLTVDAMNFRPNVPTFVERRILIERNERRTVIPCTNEEAAEFAVKQVGVATIVGAVLGWVLTDSSSGVNTGARYGVGVGTLSALTTHCIKVVDIPQGRRDVGFERREARETREVLRVQQTIETRVPIVSEPFCEERGMMLHPHYGTLKCVEISGGTIVRVLDVQYRLVPVPAQDTKVVVQDGNPCKAGFRPFLRQGGGEPTRKVCGRKVGEEIVEQYDL